MDITWYGHSCFRLTQRNYATIVTDPYDAKTIGYSNLKLKADVVTVSHDAPGHNFTDAVESTHVLTVPGEYEIGGVFIVGEAMVDTSVEDPRYNIVYVIDYDGLTVAHLGDLDHIPSQSAVDGLGQVDVALVPVGGGGGLTASQAAEVISLLEPSIVVPMHYKTNHTDLELEGVERFLKEMGVSNTEDIEIVDTLKLTTRANLPEGTQIVVLDAKE
ncbi:MAG: MBL fold metallo-hydrolase [Chloroflexi bacterium]|nr:MBL fold metallo-hydrolase [Chloroflexota bacterium]